MSKKRRRYIILRVTRSVTAESLRKLVEKAYAELFGELSLAEASPRIVRQDDDKFILECRHYLVPKMILALASITEFDGLPIAIRTIKISGTMRKAKEIVYGE